MAIRIRFLSALLSIAVVAACSSVPPPVPSSSGSATPPVAAASPTGAIASSSPLSPPAAQPPPTSEQLIAQALAAGTIDYETSIRYRAYALYGDPRLPQAYQSSVIDYEAGMYLAAEVQANKDSKLGAATLAEIAPFLARPDDPISVFYHAPSSANAPGREGVVMGTSRAAARGVGPPAASIRTAQGNCAGYATAGKNPDGSPVFFSCLASPTPVRLWARTGGPLGEDGLKVLGGDVTRIYPQLAHFLIDPKADAGKAGVETNPDSAIDVYLINFGAIDPRAGYCFAQTAGSLPAECRLAHLGFTQVADPVTGSISSGYVVVQAGRDLTTTRATLAHELFHVAQFAYDYTEGSWLMESTAQWGEYRILKELGWSLDVTHKPLEGTNGLFQNLGNPLTRVNGWHEYGAYLYFYLAQMEKGDGIVRSVWETAGAPGLQDYRAADKEIPFKEFFPKFALLDWNRDPIDPRYRNTKDPSFPEGPQYQPFDFGGRQEISMTGLRVAPLLADVDPLSIRYFHFDFLDKNVRTVVFQNSLAGQPDAAVQALVRIGDVWQKPRDWTTEQKVTFCRDAPDQDVRELIVIVSNSGLGEALAPSQDPRVEGKPEPCGHWAGTVSKSYMKKMVGPGFSDIENGSISASVTWEVDPTAGRDANEAVVYKPVAGQLGWQYKGSISATGFSCTISGSGTVPLAKLDYSDPNYHGRDGYLVTWADPSGQRLYGANGVIISKEDIFPLKFSCLNPPFPPSWESDWLHVTDDPDKEAPYGGLPIGEDGAIRGTDTTDNCTGSGGEGSVDRCIWKWDFELVP